MNVNEERNNVGRVNCSFSRATTPSDVPSTFASRRSAARVVAAVASTGLLVGMGAVGVGPALAAPAPDPTDCNLQNTVTAPEVAADIQDLLDLDTPLVCLSGTFTFANPLTFNHDLTLIGLTPDTVLNGGDDTRILVGTEPTTTTTVSNLEFRQGLATPVAIGPGLLVEGGAISTLGNVAVFGSRFLSNLGGKGGGAIFASGTVDINDSTFVDNEVDDPSGFNGGAVLAVGAITVSNSEFLGNVATGQGGAIFSEAGVIVTDSELTDNESQDDGGAIFALGLIYVTNSNFEVNLATGRGGGIFSDAGVLVADSTFSDNESQGDGGAIFTESYVGGIPPSMGSTFTDNTADSNLDGSGSGGAIYARNAITVNRYTFSGNAAAEGGALYSGSTVDSLNSTFFANIATGEGGAIYTREGSVAFSTFFNNQAADFDPGVPQNIPGQAIHLEASSGSILPIEGSIFVGRPVESQLGVGVGDGSMSTFRDVGGNVFSTASAQEPNLPNPPASTLFEQSALDLFGTNPELAANSGPTETLALVSGSPAIDAVPDVTGFSVNSDQRGLPRPGPGGQRADAGAFEFQAATPGQVVGLSGTPGNGSVALSWSAPSSSGGSPITDYVIEQNSGSGWVQVVDGVSTATSFTVTGLTNGTSYQFRVSAVNAVGSGVVSAVSASLVPAAGIPGQVVGLSGTPGNGSVALSWSAPSSTGGSPITDYVIEQNSGSGWVRVVDGVSTATSFTVTGLANGTSYQFRVSAVNAVGSGVVSAASASVIPAAGVTPPGSGVTSPAAPTTPAVLGVTGSSPAAGWLAGGAALLMALGSTLMVLKRRRFR